MEIEDRVKEELEGLKEQVSELIKMKSAAVSKLGLISRENKKLRVKVAEGEKAREMVATLRERGACPPGSAFPHSCRIRNNCDECWRNYTT